MRSILILFVGWLSAVASESAAASYDVSLADWTPRVPSWTPASSNGMPLWISWQGKPYRVSTEPLNDPSGAPYDVVVITDQQGAIANLSREDREELAWYHRMAQYGPMMGHAPNERELMRVLQASIGLNVLSSSLIDKAIAFQEAAVDLGVIASVGYATRMKAILAAADDLLIDAMADAVRAAPKAAARDWARASLRRNLPKIEHQLRFGRARAQGWGNSPNRPLDPSDIRAAYARGTAIWVDVLPSMALLLATQDDPSANAQIGRLIMSGGDTLATIAQGQVPGLQIVSEVFNSTDMLVQLASTIPPFARYQDEIDDRSKRLAASDAGLGDAPTEAIRTKFILVPAVPASLPATTPKNEITLLKEDFSGSSGILWNRELAKAGPAGFISIDGFFHVLRNGAGGSGQSVSISIPLDILVTGNIHISFEANPIMRSVRNGCGDRCLEFPIKVLLRVEDAAGGLHNVYYGVNYGPAVGSVTLRNRRGVMVHGESVSRPRGEMSKVSHTLQDTVPEAARLLGLSVMGRGWDFEGKLDNLIMTMSGTR